MGVGVAQLAKLLLQWLLVRVGITVEAEKIDVDAIGSLLSNIRAQRRTIRVLVGIEKDVCTVILVIAVSMVSPLFRLMRGRGNLLSSTAIRL